MKKQQTREIKPSQQCQKYFQATLLSQEPKNSNYLEFFLHVDANPRGATDLGLRMGSHCAYVGPDRGICYKQNLSDIKSSSLKLNYKFDLLCIS